ncbi:hypothetical protein BSKO_05992 [Bryopsis sp. KO-2023]|nr:hypothetical protein BSKO_05992 [Bryopsis sp. KO-2023]
MDEVIHKKFINHGEVADPRPEQGNGGSYRVYFDKKNSKLDEQFAHQVDTGGSGASSNIFRGVTIHVNGHTVPSHQELKQLMALHGGGFRNYYVRSKVTHFICSNLPDTKLHQLRHERNPVPIVRPDWVVASINAGKMLPLEDFFLERIRDAPGQKMLKAFAKHKVDPMAAAEKYPTLAPPPKENTISAVQKSLEGEKNDTNDGQLQIAHPFGQNTIPAAERGGREDANSGVLPENQQDYILDEEIAEGSDTNEQVPPNVDEGGVSEVECQGKVESGVFKQDVVEAMEGTEKGVNLAEESERVVDGMNEEGSDWLEARQVAAEKRAACAVLKGPPQTSRSGPEFMETYFKASRLHFIGTWRTRIENLAASMIDGAPAPVRDKNVEPVIVHLDMDCFFASAAVVGKPVLRGKPLAVCHSNSEKGPGEVSAANYEARAFGVKANMFISKAKELCPQLISVPYEFDKYQEISEKVYRITMTATGCVQPISCDEAFLDISGLGDPDVLVSKIRKQIEEETECTASAGIGPNMLLARLATKEGKPNGQFRIKQCDAHQFLVKLPIGSLPGVGWSLRKTATSLGIETVVDLLEKSKEFLQQHFGQKMGETLHKYARGQDEREVKPPGARKSIGAECNWGVRFDGILDAKKFLEQLSKEVSNRMKEAAAKGRSMTLKVKRKRVGAPEPRKFLGCGICDSLSRSVTISGFTDSEKDIFSSCWTMLKALGVPAPEIRGMGITVSKFDSDSTSAAAKTSVGGLARAKAPPPIHAYDKNKPHPWVKLDSSKKEALPENSKEKGNPADGVGVVRQSTELSDRCMGGPSAAPSAEKKEKPEKMAKEKAKGPLAAMFANVEKRKIEGDDPGKGPLLPSPPTVSPAGPSSPGVQPLPPASQIDMDVWDALPLITRRELENAYSLQQMEPIPRSSAKVKKRGRPANPSSVNIRKRVKRAGGPPTVPKSRASRSIPAGGGDMNDMFGCLSWSQIDPEVLASLPADIRNEIKVSLPRVRLRGPNTMNQDSQRTNGDSGPINDCGKVEGPSAKRQVDKRAVRVDHQTELEKAVDRVKEVCGKSTMQPNELKELAKQLQDWLVGLDPMSDWMLRGLKRIQSLGRTLDGFLECSMEIVEFVQDWVKKEHGFRLNLFNPLLDDT